MHIFPSASLFARVTAFGVGVVGVGAVFVACAAAPLQSPTDACARVAPARDADSVCPLLPGMSVPDVAVTTVDLRAYAGEPPVASAAPVTSGINWS